MIHYAAFAPLSFFVFLGVCLPVGTLFPLGSSSVVTSTGAGLITYFSMPCAQGLKVPPLLRRVAPPYVLVLGFILSTMQSYGLIFICQIIYGLFFIFFEKTFNLARKRTLYFLFMQKVPLKSTFFLCNLCVLNLCPDTHKLSARVHY